MPLYRVSYISRAPESRGALRGKFVGSILQRAQEKNQDYGVTGMLVYADDYFLQTIEGSRPIVSRLMRKIMDDERHRDVEIVEAKHVTSRHFGHDMICYDLDSRKTPLLMRYSVSSGFCPYELTPQSLDELFAELWAIAKRDRAPGNKGARQAA